MEGIQNVLSFYIKLPFEIGFLFLFLIYTYLRIIITKVLPSSKKSLDDEVILITGSSKGIGREMALYLAKNHPSSKLVLWDCDAPENITTAEMVKNYGVSVHLYTVDITDRIEVEVTALQVSREVGDVTILINNAGIAGYGAILDQTPQLIEKTIQVNLLSHFWTLRAVLPNMIALNHGHIVTVCSLASYGALKYGVPYTASKYGVRGYIKSLRSELRSDIRPTDNIKFTTVYPYFVNTTMTDRIKLSMKFGALDVLMKAEEVARQAIEGMQRNEEHVIVPSDMELPVMLLNMCPQSFQDKLGDWITQDTTFTKE